MRRDRIYGLIALAVLLGTPSAVDAITGPEKLSPSQMAPVIESTSVADRPYIEMDRSEASREEPQDDPDEADLIEAALLDQGYFRDDVPLSFDLQDLLHNAAEESGIPYELALAVVERETDFRNIIGDDGCSIGYMQIQVRWHRDRMDRLGVSDLSDPYGNFRVGCDYLAELLSRFGDDTKNGTHKALMAYNMGPSGASQFWARGVYESEYSRAVLAAAERWTDK